MPLNVHKPHIFEKCEVVNNFVINKCVLLIKLQWKMASESGFCNRSPAIKIEGLH